MSSGDVRLFGTSTERLSVRSRAQRVAWVPQDESPRDNVRLIEYVLYGRYAHLRPFEGETAQDRTLAQTALAEVGLADRADDGIRTLSGGERQRLLLARALAQAAPILLLDEPTAHLDIGHQLDLLVRVRAMVRDRHVLAIAALHDLNLAARFADRVVVLSHGRVVADGIPHEVLDPPLLRTVWGVDAELRRDPRTGQPYLLPRRTLEPPRPAAASGTPAPIVHVVGGGGAAAPILRDLFAAGYTLTAGALPLLDSDAETADELGVPFAAEVPFAPLGEEARARHRALLAAAATIVVAPFAVGPSNLANLEDLEGWAPRTPVVLLGGSPAVGRDFTDGRATRAWERLVAEGATPLADPAELGPVLAKLLARSAEPRAAPGPAP
jgi:iron complex transport system ATP-binding protein